ncbi:MAG: hypothetical protein KJ666_00010 [Bacteroidetes bacterium]|nr:hypothetical protein [Bacteroidota bacterium]
MNKKAFDGDGLPRPACHYIACPFIAILWRAILWQARFVLLKMNGGGNDIFGFLSSLDPSDLYKKFIDRIQLQQQDQIKHEPLV